MIWDIVEHITIRVNNSHYSKERVCKDHKECSISMGRFRIMVFNAIFNNISVISWRSVLLVEETGVPGEKPLICHKSLTNFIT
jgi:hypothetical protein